MNKKKKIVIISIVIVIIIALIVGVIIFLNTRNSNGDSKTSSGTTKISNLYDNLSKEKMFSFTTIIDDNNKEVYAKSSNVAYIDTIYNGDESKFVIKDGNSYLLNDDSKIYYTYQNNDVNFNKVLEQLDEIKNAELVEGKEEIEGKEYYYEEYSGFTNFAFKLSDTETEDVKTRFYFDGNDLVYIKTIIGDTQELLKIEITDKVDSTLFEIPTDYREM